MLCNVSRAAGCLHQLTRSLFKLYILDKHSAFLSQVQERSFHCNVFFSIRGSLQPHSQSLLEDSRPHRAPLAPGSRCIRVNKECLVHCSSLSCAGYLAPKSPNATTYNRSQFDGVIFRNVRRVEELLRRVREESGMISSLERKELDRYLIPREEFSALAESMENGNEDIFESDISSSSTSLPEHHLLPLFLGF